MSDQNRNYIGGANIAGILGISPFRTPLMEYMTMIGEAPPDTQERRDFFKRRKSFEPVAAEIFKEHTGLSIVNLNQRYDDPHLPFVKAEIDFESEDGANGEIKTCHPLAAKDWGDTGSDECPVYVTAQAMHGLAVRGKDLCRVLAMIGFDDVRIYEIRRDESIIKGLREHEIAFWNNHVLPRVPPPATTVGDVLTLFTQDLGSIAEADEATYAVWKRLKELKPVVKDIEELEDRLKLFMGSAATLTHEGKILATWKTQSSTRVSTTKLREAHPDIAAQFAETSSFRVLRIK